MMSKQELLHLTDLIRQKLLIVHNQEPTFCCLGYEHNPQLEIWHKEGKQPMLTKDSLSDKSFNKQKTDAIGLKYDINTKINKLYHVRKRSHFDWLWLWLRYETKFSFTLARIQPKILKTVFTKLLFPPFTNVFCNNNSNKSFWWQEIWVIIDERIRGVKVKVKVKIHHENKIWILTI